jgi:hypothetical protein
MAAYAAESEYSLTIADLLYPIEELNYDDLINPSYSTNHSSETSSPPRTTTVTSPTTNDIFCTNNACGCGAAFHRAFELKKHLDQVKRPYICSYANCPGPITAFARKYDCRRHEREKHGKQRAIMLYCPVISCKRHTRGFPRKDHLKLHIRNKHPQLVQSPPSARSHAPAPANRVTMAQVLQRSTQRQPQQQHQPPSPFSAASSPSRNPLALSPTLTPATAASSPLAAIGAARESSFMEGLRAQREALARQLLDVEVAIQAQAQGRVVNGIAWLTQPQEMAENRDVEWNWDWDTADVVHGMRMAMETNMGAGMGMGMGMGMGLGMGLY